jgi:hypothetical protein
VLAVGYALIRLFRFHGRHDVLHIKPNKRASASAANVRRNTRIGQSIAAPLCNGPRPFLRPCGLKFQ